jgi:micrococcal nuclease
MFQKLRLFLFSILLLTLLLLPFACAPSSTTTLTSALVTRVIDGDTIVIAGGAHVRYIGMDTPEMLPQPQPFAVAATNANRNLVDGKTVRLVKDISETDRYGRLLRYVYVGDIFVNAELVRQGLAVAKAYPPDTKYQSLLKNTETEAKNAGRGMWAK